MVSLSLKPPEEIFQADFHLWPTAFMGSRTTASRLTAAPMFRFLLNGLLVCAAIFALQLLVCIPCAYALAKLRFHGRDTVLRGAGSACCCRLKPSPFRISSC
jgi:multiple sugar transport system permease protein